MFRLLNISKATSRNSMNQLIRCTILADGTTDPLPLTGEDIEGLMDDTEISYGSVAITPNGDIASMGNDGQWGNWL